MQVSLRIFIILIGRDNSSLEGKTDHNTIQFRLRACSYLTKALTVTIRPARLGLSRSVVRVVC